MRVTVQFDIDATKFDLDDLEAACARMLHVAAARIIKDGTPDPDSLGFELRLSTPEEEIRGKITNRYAEEADTAVDLRLAACETALANTANSIGQAYRGEYNDVEELASLIRNAYRACELWSEDPDELSRLNGLKL